MTADIFSLKKQLVVYGSHHNNKVNVAIHMIFVPTIFWTGNLVEKTLFFILN
jgi:uncharacterized membrane protein YGL010W